MSRVMYDAIVPWWDGVATGQLPADAPEITPAFAEFAQLQRRMTKVVFSNTIQSGDARIVIRGDLASQLAKLKQQDGVDIILSGGPATLGPIASTPGLVDEYLIAVHPAVVTAGPRMFGRLSRDLLWNSYTPRCSNAGSVVLHYRAIAGRLHLGGPPVLVTNIVVPSLQTAARSIYLLPDRILVRDRRTYAEMSHASCHIQVGVTQFIEAGPQRTVRWSVQPGGTST